MASFRATLAEQRWDDHRYYHHSRINQSLHLFSALCFLSSYLLLLSSPVAAAMVGWLLAMISRQVGHFFFEPKDYDVVNQATHEYKEQIKVGYNLRRKVVLLSIWALSPIALYFAPTLGGVFERASGAGDFLRHLSSVWLTLGAAALAFRVAQLWVQKDALTGMVWLTKILTDPFHDVMLYYKAPLYLLRGELFDGMEPKRSS
jgi:hypothetical protein